MSEEIKSKNMSFSRSLSKLEAASESKLRETMDDETKTEKMRRKSRFDDSAEMFRGLITGDDHFHSRSSEFTPLWG